MQIVVGKQLINYHRVLGGEKTLLILHGWGRSSDEWRFLGESRELLKEYTIYIVDVALRVLRF